MFAPSRPAFLPGRCAVCRSWPTRTLCTDCHQRFATPRPRCPRCALPSTLTGSDGQDGCPDCRTAPWALDACRAAVDYVFPWNELLGAYKFQRQSGYSRLLARLLLDSPGVKDSLAALGPQDCLSPLPLSAQRLAERGFNQSWELARTLHRLSACRARLDARALLRIRHTEAQTRLDREQRLANVRGAFLVEPDAAARLRARTVVLVDDVMTSGASMQAAALALKQVGAARVEALVVARTPP